MIIMAFASQAPGSPFRRLADKFNWPEEVRTKRLEFDFSVSVASTRYDRTITGALEWMQANNGFMMAAAIRQKIDPEKVVPFRRRVVDCGINSVSGIPWATLAIKNSDRFHRRSFFSFEEVRKFMGGNYLDAYLLGTPPQRWVKPVDSEASASATTQQTPAQAAFIRQSLLQSAMNPVTFPRPDPNSVDLGEGTDEMVQ